MKKVIIILAIAVCASSTVYVVGQQHDKEAMEHPRIEKAIHELEDAIDYMQNAPSDFGGYKMKAIRDSKKAVESLKMALRYREHRDHHDHDHN
jgi:hypothetical protein